MAKISFGSTGITVEKNGFGALPLQRIPVEEAAALMRRAFEGGMEFFDTARAYSDSEIKMGLAFEGVRRQVVIATKTHAKTGDVLRQHLEQSLQNLKTDYIDLYQFHNPSAVPRPGDGSGLYEAALKAKEEGLIRHIGITNHNLSVAKEAIESGLFESLQFPFNYLSSSQELELPSLCAQKGMGFIAMKAMSGGLFQNGRASFTHIASFPNVIPIWGIQRQSELDEFLSLMKAPPTMDEEIAAVIEADKTSLQGEFCRGCGYCMPCPVGIEINNAARMSLMLRRAVTAQWTSPEWQEKMKKIENCLNCGACASKCPYHLNTPELLRKNYEDYKTFLK
ncbi:MAG: aldo/keto reductase [Oscillospiraceae bacterium]|nr:aldo/keto reductase [Oscillospiraceae bacterium]